MSLRIPLFTAAALLAFAANSLLCRLALAEHRIDAASFTTVRIVSGALVLALLAWRRKAARSGGGGFVSALALVGYAAPFSYAYLRLGAGLGALVLFGAVQITMLAWGIARGERPRPLVWMGLVLALAGLATLTLPGATAPDPVGTVMMIAAGASWGAYSLRGRTTAGDPVVVTAANFLRAAPFALAILGLQAGLAQVHADPIGITLAIASGAIASGIGYSVWYAALPGLTATRAAVVQLLVPVLAAGGGILWLDEAPTLRLALAGATILAGIGLAIRGRS